MSIPRVSVRDHPSGTIMSDGVATTQSLNQMIVKVSQTIDATASELVKLEANLQDMKSQEQVMSKDLASVRARLYNRKRLSVIRSLAVPTVSQSEVEALSQAFKSLAVSVSETQHQIEKIEDEVKITRATHQRLQAHYDQLNERYGDMKLSIATDTFLESKAAPIHCS